MGVTLRATRSRDWDMGYMRFNKLREDIKDYLWRNRDGIATVATVHFLNQSDCDGKLTHKECKCLLNDIEDMPDEGYLYGYIGRGEENCMTLTDFKAMLQSCYSHRCNLIWF